MTEQPKVLPFWVAGSSVTTDEIAEVRHPGDGSLVARYSVPDAGAVEAAVAAAVAVRGEWQASTAAARAAVLDHLSQSLQNGIDEVAELITAENGKPLMWSRGEVTRAISTFRWAAEEARRFGGELQRLDTDPAAAGRAAIIRRFPRGPVLGIAPFNFPLNLVAHKLAPAIAVGTPIIVKPSPKTPLSALLLGDLLAETDLPAGAVSVLPVDTEATKQLIEDPRLPVISFTGSDVVGRAIARSVPLKHVTLELGGDAAAVVCADYSSEKDLDWAATRIATFGMYQAGQSCIGVQRVIVAESLAASFTERLVAAVNELPTGSPWDAATVVGPVIDEASGARIESWISGAVNGGARVLCGGARNGTSVEPTVITDVPADSYLANNEVFGPVVIISTVGDFDEALAKVNDSRFGLQTGLFTHDIQNAFRAFRELEVGGVVIGDVPSFRADQMPYGGVKDSGNGREGIRFAMADYTEERVMVLTGIDL